MAVLKNGMKITTNNITMPAKKFDMKRFFLVMARLKYTLTVFLLVMNLNSITARITDRITIQTLIIRSAYEPISLPRNMQYL
ncbi:MAG: hypothetical protein GX824_02620 [Clostridiales bacterium]|nr:hypothetical protein [Clostridiales bacterium]